MANPTGREPLGLVMALRDLRLTPEAASALEHLSSLTGISKAALARRYLTEGLVADGLLTSAAPTPLTPTTGRTTHDV